MGQPKVLGQGRPGQECLVVLGLAALFWASPVAANPPGAIPERSPRHQRALASFEGFAESWMVKMRQAAAARRPASTARTGGYRGVGDAFEVELRPTGRPRTPWVGLLRYSEIDYACGQAEGPRCAPTARRGVTEIFRFQNGRWVY